MPHRPEDAPRTRRLLVLTLVTAGLLPLLGCGSDQVPVWPVSGRVVFEDGAPVRSGTIEFLSDEHDITASAQLDSEGRFTLGTYDTDDGACAGQHRVIIVQMIINDGTINHSMDHGRPVPQQFSSYEDSGLSATVREIEQNILTITLPEVRR